MEYKKDEIIEYLNKLDNLISFYQTIALERFQQGNYAMETYYVGKLTALQEVRSEITKIIADPIRVK